MSPDEIRTAIRTVIAQHAKLAVDISTLGDDADLFEAGMTSFASVNVMIALEDAFDLEFPDLMMNRSSFETVDAIAAAVTSLGATPA
jgi:acyl carrier protein